MPSLRAKNARVERDFDPSRYSTRLIALKFAYLGQRYNGFEHHTNNRTPLPTIEEELWKAFNKARLIFPTDSLSINTEVNWEGCEYSKCGRTDKGVSAFGQVIGIRVRSNRPLAYSTSNGGTVAESLETASPPLRTETMTLRDEPISSLSLDDLSYNGSLSFHPTNDEIRYPQVLNRLLPLDIRVLAWCPAPPLNFSARFSCKERRYRYFFTQPAFNPTPGVAGVLNPGSHQSSVNARRDGWLDIGAMQTAAKHFEGVHDFRNFCKVDASKQINNFERKIFHSEIREVDPKTEPAAYISGSDFAEFGSGSMNNGRSSNIDTNSKVITPKLYVFVLHGSAFLWHQVRHMIAILFLVGQGLESAEVVDRLLDTKQIPQKPMYEMADDAPLVLWDCIFPREGSDSRKDALEWLYIGDQHSEGEEVTAKGNGKFGLGGVVDDLWKIWRQKRMDEILAGMLLNVAVAQGNRLEMEMLTAKQDSRQARKPSSQKLYHGGNSASLKGRYVPLLERPRMESVETINARYAAKKGFEDPNTVPDTGFRKVKLLPREAETREDGPPFNQSEDDLAKFRSHGFDQ